MTQKKNLFGDFIWLVCSISIISLFYHGVTEFIFEKLGLEYLKTVVVIVLLFLSILVIALILRLIVIKLNIARIKENRLISCLASIFVVLAFIAGRAIIYNSQLRLIYENDIANRYYSKFFIALDGKVFFNLDSVKNINASIASACFKFLGNTAQGVYAANLICAFVGFILFYFGVKAFFGRISAFVTGIGMSFIPVFTGLKLDDSCYLTEFMLFALCFYFLSLLYRSYSHLAVFYPLLIASAFICGLLFLYDAICFGFLLILIILVIINPSKKCIVKVSSLFIALLFWILGFLAPYLSGFVRGAYTFDRVINEAVRIITAGYFDLEQFKSIYRNQSICLLIISSIVYLVLYLLYKYDLSYIAGSLFIIVLASSSYYILPDSYTYSYVIAALLLVLSGEGISKLLRSEKKNTEHITEEYASDGFAISEILNDDITDEATINDDENDDLSDDFYTVFKAQEDGPKPEDDSEQVKFNMQSLDWSKLSEARLIDYPDNTVNTVDTVDTVDVASTDTEIAEVEIIELDIKAKIKKPDLKRYNRVSDSEFDYEVTEKDLHFDVDVNF